MTIKLGVVADDLSGALDASAPFAARGMSTLVALDASALPGCLALEPDVIAVSSDSREIAPSDATEAVAACLRKLPAGLNLFKKIDSRLKGNIAAELDAFSFSRALVVPAIPGFGRAVRDGALCGFGVDAPIDIAERLGRHAGRAAVPDVSTQGDIEAAVAAGGFDLPVGARSLGEALAAQMSPPPAKTAASPAAERVVFVIGSTDPITKAQIAGLREAMPELTYIAAPNGEGAAVLPPRGQVTLVEATPGAGAADGKQVVRGLAKIVSRLQLGAGDLLVVSGGATAQIVLKELGIGWLELMGEALPGLPLARAGEITVITKSGGFGDEGTLVRLLDRLVTPLETTGSSWPTR